MDIVADIGATNARFQPVENGALLAEPVVLPTADFSEGRLLVAAAKAALGFSDIDRALLAVAGPALDGHKIEVTNTGLLLETSVCAEVLGCPVQLANDFFALAHGVPHFAELKQIGGGDIKARTKGLLGPGSGLGMATLVPVGRVEGRPGAWQVIASEGGHADLAPSSHLEAELWGLLLEHHGHVCWETVLCGAGLQNLYAAMSALWGGRPDELSAADIVAQGESMADPVCHQTLETFCALLGAAAGNLALTVTATGGIYIGGGIVPRMLDFIVSSPMRRRFEERGEMADLVREIPILAIMDTNPGLVGALHCLESWDRRTPAAT